MPITQLTPDSSFNDFADAFAEHQMAMYRRELSIIGYKAVNAMRGYGPMTYLDQSGNLRSSTGFVLVDDGKIVDMSSFDVVAGGYKGAEEGRSFAKLMASKHKKGLVLILVAGMEYAVHVSNRGRDVMDSGIITAESLVRTLLSKLGI